MSVPVPHIDPGKIRVQNAWFMLLYAWGLARWRGRWAAESESAPNLLGLIAKVLSDCTQQLLRRQLARSFSRRSAELRGIRGKIDISRSIKQMSFQAGRAYCEFPELSIDVPRNRIIRSTLDRLASDPRLDVGARSEVVKALRHEIRGLVRALEGVAIVPLQQSDFTGLQLGRNDEPYRLPLLLCYLVRQLGMPTEKSGDEAMAKLVRDEIRFPDLFENFVRNFYRARLHGCRVESEQLSWGDEFKSAFVPSMVTDVSIEWPGINGRRVVLDTKYYRKFLNSRLEGHEKFLTGHLYQIYAYLRTQEDRSPIHRNAEGILLYPSSAEPFSEPMRVQGHTIRIETVDLSENWQLIEQRLLNVVGSTAQASPPAHQEEIK